MAIAAPSALQAQKGLKLSNKQAKMYELGKRYNDYSIAIRVLYERLAEDPANKALKDSLASLYFSSRSYAQAIAVAQELLEEAPQNERMLEMVAISYQNLGAVEQALEHYEQLHEQTGDVYHLYQVAVLRYRMKRYGECKLALQKIIQHPKAAKKTVTINTQGNPAQDVPLKAAAYNVKGMLLFSQNERSQAKQAFQAATKIFPEFQLAKNNLAELRRARRKGRQRSAQPQSGYPQQQSGSSRQQPQSQPQDQPQSQPQHQPQR
jgi:tetratricopeptide (TPR) repeat protein